jgi:toxin-antitoxin system PIN domain toxin
MKLADSNVWLALALRGHSYHSAAQAWFNGQAKGEVLFCRATQQSFLRLLTTAAVLARYDEPPFTNADAWAFYQQLLLDNGFPFVTNPRGLMYSGTVSPADRPRHPLWMDAYLAAFALAASHQLVTTDKAFTQFPKLDVLVLTKANP